MRKQSLFLSLAALLMACGSTTSSIASSTPASSSSPSTSEASSSEEKKSSEASVEKSSEEKISSEESSMPAEASEESGNPAESSEPAQSSASGSEGKYLFYDLADGVKPTDVYGAPWANTSAEGMINKFQKPSLKDDFYMNTTWDLQKSAKLGPNDLVYGGMPGSMQVTTNNIAKMLTEKNNSPFSDALLKAYQLYSNSDKTPEITYNKAIIDEIKAISSVSDFIRFLKNKGYNLNWAYFDLTRVDTAEVAIYTPNLGLTPSSVNWVFDPQSSESDKKQRVIDTTSYLLQQYGYDAASANALGNAGWVSDYKLFNNSLAKASRCSIASLDEEYPGTGIKEYLVSLGYTESGNVQIDSRNAACLLNLSELVNQKPECEITLQDLKNSMIVRVAFASVFSRPVDGDTGYMTLTQNLDSNATSYTPDMIRNMIFSDHITDIFDRVYIDAYETKERRQSILNTMKSVIAEYSTMLESTTWLEESTRRAAVEKVQAIRYDACYPVHLESIPTFNVDGITCYSEYMDRYHAWSNSIAMPVYENISIWGKMTATTPNALYHPNANAFVVYDGMLSNTPMETASSKEELYGSIGAVIGHEISHAFDIFGSQYDKYGMQTDWWTDNDRNAFNAKVNKIKDVWSTYENKSGMKLSCDEGMLGEIIADMGGVSITLRLASKETNFDYDKYFRAYSNTFGCIMSDAVLENMVYGGATGQQDSHPISVFRVNGVISQFAKFAETYNVEPTNKMYVAPADRLNIWG